MNKELVELVLNRAFENFEERTIDFDVDWSYLKLTSINDIIYSKIKLINTYHENNSVELIEKELSQVIIYSIIGIFQISFDNFYAVKLDKEVIMTDFVSKKNEIIDAIIRIDNSSLVQYTLQNLTSEIEFLKEIENEKVKIEDYYEIVNIALILIVSQ